MGLGDWKGRRGVGGLDMGWKGAQAGDFLTRGQCGEGEGEGACEPWRQRQGRCGRCTCALTVGKGSLSGSGGARLATPKAHSRECRSQKTRGQTLLPRVGVGQACRPPGASAVHRHRAMGGQGRGHWLELGLVRAMELRQEHGECSEWNVWPRCTRGTPGGGTCFLGVPGVHLVCGRVGHRGWG